MKNYSLLIQWSEEDRCYFAICPEFKHLLNMGGPFAHGSTWEEVGKEAAIALGGIIETLKKDNLLPIPEPQLFKED